jgi:RNA polymerase-binding transcription factor DksA
MNVTVKIRAEQSLLRELDTRLQTSWHETLQDVITDLRVHWVDVKSNATADELISVIHNYRLLDFASTQPLMEIRDTIRRIKQGTFGVCSDCGEEISGEILECQPNAKLCPACAGRLNSVLTNGHLQSLPPTSLQ